MLHKLMRWAALHAEDREAVLGLPFRQRTLRRGASIVREGDRPAHVSALISGFACRHKLVGAGDRQIIAAQIAGDVLDLQNALLRAADHGVQVMTDAEIAEIPRDAVRRLALERPAICEAMWYDTLVDASIHREWIASRGRRTALAALSHFLCELGVRMQVAGQGTLTRYALPMTQEDLGDALGLTSVHVNRTLKTLSEKGIAQKRGAAIFIHDWDRLVDEAGFSPHYLHLSDEQRGTPDGLFLQGLQPDAAPCQPPGPDPRAT
jgi:CRP-like cAMP-binding protein